jgi:cytochrome P450
MSAIAAPGPAHTIIRELSDLLAMRRRQPQQDALSRLLTSNVDGEYLSESELVVCCLWLLVGGCMTMTNLLGNTILCLIEHPEVVVQLRNTPAPLYSTIDEVLRYLPPVWSVLKTTTTELSLGSQHIPAHAQI